LVATANHPELREKLLAAGRRVNTWFTSWLYTVGSTDPERDAPRVRPAQAMLGHCHGPHGAIMNLNESWPEIEAYRRSLITILADVSDQDWRQPSLCTSWTVKDVLAHLTYQHIDVRTAAGGMIRARGNTDRMIHDVAVRRAAAMSTMELLDRFRGMLGWRRHPPGVTWREAVTDNLVHGQDIAVPLGRPLDLPIRAATVAAERCYTMRWPAMPKDWPLHTRRELRRFRLHATDTDWSIGDDAEVTAPIGDLLLLITGRLVVLPRLSGPGAEDLRTALNAALSTGVKNPSA
jgi:uncharacterized protein (TIGR03083 family)